MPHAQQQKRLVFFDNLRYLFVLIVLAEHSAHAYDGLSWWAVVDNGRSLLAGWVSAFSDVFAMPLLFYIAGYFAIPNLEKKGTAGFLAGKLKRLGIPWLVCILAVTPVFTFIHHYTRSGPAQGPGYWPIWLDEMRKALQFNSGFILSADQFAQHYMWFLSLLLLFFFLFALFSLFAPGFLHGAGNPRAPKPAGSRVNLWLFLGLGITTALVSIPTCMLMMSLCNQPEPNFILGSVIQFRPSRLIFYALYFVLGVVTYRNNWLERGWFTGAPVIWTASFAVLLPAFSAVYFLMSFGAPENRGIYAPIYFLLLNFLCAACLGLSLRLGYKYWNRPNQWNKSLAANSYNIYLSHYAFVMAAQLALLPLGAIPLTVKYVMVVFFSGVMAYITSRWLITPRPRTALLVVFGVWLAMVLAIRP